MVEPATVGAVVLLIAAFVVAVKVLKTVIETVLVTGISAVFYVILAVSMEYPLTLDSVATFAAAGTFLYITYSVLFPLMKLGWKAVKVPFDLFSWLGDGVSSLNLGRAVEFFTKDVEKDEDSEEETMETKEVVLDKVAKDKEED